MELMEGHELSEMSEKGGAGAEPDHWIGGGIMNKDNRDMGAPHAPANHSQLDEKELQGPGKINDIYSNGV
ncbi:hypothetical protein PENSUB_6763 [Penicillium subrubescens]|jgi:hypothetical protein|uniref:Uncharacterized protein n=1 Tax=Penicillium subrubescens TaxID=1316194 RepID=A0A1Q5TVL2_9EURO|nr:hypothetical protein PENSUB_6763 [Penicillium subrubescens]